MRRINVAMVGLAWICCGLWAAGRTNADNVRFASVNEKSESWRFPIIWGVAGGPISAFITAVMTPNYGWQVFEHGGLTILGKKELLRECSNYRRDECISHGWGQMIKDAEFSMQHDANRAGGSHE